MNSYIKYAKERLMKFKYPELVQSKFQAMDALFDKIEINTILKSNDAISSILMEEAVTAKYVNLYYIIHIYILIKKSLS